MWNDEDDSEDEILVNDEINLFDMEVYLAVKCGSPSSVKKIKEWIDQGQLDARSKVQVWGEAESILSLAIGYSKPEVVKLLLSECCDIDPSVIFGCVLGARLHMVKLFVEHGVSLNAIDEQGNNVLHVLAMNIPFSWRSMGLFIYCVDFGCDIDKKNHDGQTPLHKVVEGDFPFLAQFEASLLLKMKVLLLAGCKVDVLDSSGRTPVHSIANHISNATQRPMKEKMLRMLGKARVDVLGILSAGGSYLASTDIEIVADVMRRRHLHSMDVQIQEKSVNEVESALSILNGEDIPKVNCSSVSF